MNKILNKLIFLTILFLVGCAANKEFYFSNEYNIKGFQYVHIPQLFYDEGKREDIYGVRVIATKYLRSKGFLVIEENEVRKLSLSAQGLVLICNISHDYDNTRIELTTIDAQKVYSGFGENAGTFDSFHGNYDAGISNAFSGFSNYRHSYNPKYAYDPIKKIKEQYKDWERVVQTEVEIRNYLDSNISKIDPIEGIWTETNDKQYRIAITKDLNKKNRDFLISILETDNPYWLPQMVKAELTKTAYKGAYSTDWYMSDHTKVGTTSFLKDKGLIEIELPSGKNQETEKIKYVKIYPIKNDEESTLSKDEKVKSTGSGFIIAETGLLVTNWHVVNGNNSIEVYLPQIEKSYFAEIVLKDANNDVAILRLKDFEYSKIFEKSPPFTIIQSNQSKLGQDVFTLGFPLGDILGKSAKLSTGTLNSLYGLKDDPRLFQISTPIQPGNSGGALFNKNGEIVGIVVASLNAKYFYENADIIPQNVNFAVKSDYLLNLISMLPEEPSIKKRQNRLLGLKLEKQIEEISPFIVTIKVK